MTVTGVPGHLYRRDPVTGYWKARGRPDLIPGNRSQLVYGTYTPSEDTAGPPAGATLTTVNPTDSLPTSKGNVAPTSPGVWTITTAGTVIQGVDVHGTIRYRAGGIITRVFRLRGRPKVSNPAAGYYQPAADLESSTITASPPLFEDGLVSIDDPGPEQYCFKGRAATIHRCIAEHGVDNIQHYLGPLAVRGSILRRKQWFANDPNQGPEGAHTDDAQEQGGSGSSLILVGNVIEAGFAGAGSSNVGLLIQTQSGLGNIAAPYWVEYNDFLSRNPSGAANAIPVNIATTDGFRSFRYNRVELGRDNYHVIARSGIRSTIQAEPGNVDYHTGATIVVANGG